MTEEIIYFEAYFISEKYILYMKEFPLARAL